MFGLNKSRNEVVGLPDKPDDLNILIEWKDPISSSKNPVRTAKKADLGVGVEWAWSPANGLAGSPITTSTLGWAFGDNWLNDHDVPWSWWWNFIAYSGKTEADERTIATHMLLRAWRDMLNINWLTITY